MDFYALEGGRLLLKNGKPIARFTADDNAQLCELDAFTSELVGVLNALEVAKESMRHLAVRCVNESFVLRRDAL